MQNIPLNRQYTAIIVDDDPEAVLSLNKLLESDPRAKVVATFNNPSNVMKKLLEKPIDLLFLDISMPNEDGLHFAGRLQSENIETRVVFTTGHRELAIQAFDLKPFDYLVKPFGHESVTRVINRFANTILSEKTRKKFVDWHINSSDKVKLRSKNGFIFVPHNEILMFTPKDGYCEITLIDGTNEKVYHQLKDIPDLITNLNFLKINRSAIINTDYIRRVDKKEKLIQIKNGDRQYIFEVTKDSMKIIETLGTVKLG
jgi:DNA-binding LytR/AlgR family response regulator